MSGIEKALKQWVDKEMTPINKFKKRSFNDEVFTGV